jgi:uncharacterized protein YkwD
VAETRSSAEERERASRSASGQGGSTDTIPPITTTVPAPIPEDEVVVAAAASPAAAPAPSSAPANKAASDSPAPTHKPVSTSPPTTAAPAKATTTVAASAAPSNVDDFLVSALNKERSARGLAPLTVDATLTKKAQDWAAQMGRNGAMSHSGSGAPAGFNAFGENVLRASSGTTAGSMHNLWLGSAGHRKNMLQPGFDRVGIGAVCVNGSVYAAQMFGHASASGDANLSREVPDAAAQAPVSGGPSCG